MPNPIVDGSVVTLVADSGDTVWYNDGTIAKDLGTPEFKKANSDVFIVHPGAADQARVAAVAA